MAIAAAMAPAMVVVSQSAAEAAISIDTNAYYVIVNANSGKAIDLWEWSTVDGGEFRQWARTDAVNQQFQFVSSGSGLYRLKNRHSGKAVDVWGWSTLDGAEIRQYTDLNGANQQFSLLGSANSAVRFINKNSGKALEVWEWATTDGARLSQFTDAAAANQTWNLVKVGTASSGRTWSNTADGFAQGTTGGAGGATVTVSNYADLLSYATSATAYTIRISGTITVPTYGYEIPVKSNKTLIGVGTSGRIKGGGIFLGAGVKNVIIRNLTIGDTLMASDDPDDKDFDYDGIQMDTASNVWIDHVKFQNTNDGYLDSRKDTTNVTVSWSIFGSHNKNIGIGWTTNVTARMTLHHNWIHDTNQRNPSADNLQYAHLYNNYLINVASYGNYARGATKMVLENSYFQNVKDAWTYDAANGAQLRQSGSTCVSCTGNQTTSGSAFTPSSFYSYTLDATANVPTIVKTYSGPQANIGL